MILYNGSEDIRSCETEGYGQCGHSVVTPMLAMTKPLPKRHILPANVRYLNQFEEIIFVKRKPPSKRLKEKFIPAFKLEQTSPVTGSSMVNLDALNISSRSHVEQKRMYCLIHVDVSSLRGLGKDTYA